MTAYQGGNIYAAVLIASFFASGYAAFVYSPWWFLGCVPCIAQLIYGMKH